MSTESTGSTGTYGAPTTPSCCFRMAVSEAPQGSSARQSAYSFGSVPPQSARNSRALSHIGCGPSVRAIGAPRGLLGAADEATARARAEAAGAQLLATPDDAYAAQQAEFAKSQARAPEAQARILSDSLASDRATVARAVTEMLSEDLRDDIAGVRQPTLMLYPFRAGGPFTAAQVDAAYAAQYAAMPRVRLIRIDDSAHFIADDAPDAVAAALADALGAD